MSEYRIRKAKPIAAEMRVPGDFAISQRALIIAGLANGPSVLTGFLPAGECLDTIQALRMLGVKFDYLAPGDLDFPWVSDGKDGPLGPSRLRVRGTGGKLTAPGGVVDCGHSSDAPVLLAGVLAAQSFVTELRGIGGEALQQLTGPLKRMGVVLKTAGPDALVTVEGNSQLKGVAVEGKISAAVSRDALLLAGMRAHGRTELTDSSAGPDHVERLLHYYQVKTLRKGAAVSVWGGQVPESRDLHIPGDFSYAAPFMAAAAAQPGSTLTVRGTGLNATRTAFLRVLVRMGAQVMEEINDARTGEPQGNVIVRGAPLKSTVIEAKDTDALREELPALMVAASLAAGSTVIHQTPGTAERMARMTHNLRLMGVEVASLTEGVGIKGQNGKPLQPGLMNASGDPYMAMACAVAGFFTDGETILEDVQCVESRWFGFGRDLERFQSREISEGHITPMLHVMVKAGKGKAAKAKTKAQKAE